MTAEQKHLDAAEVVVEIKNMESRILSKFTQLEGAVEKAQGQAQESGAASQEAKAAAETIAKQYNELFDRLQEIEQRRAARQQESEGLNIGKMFSESEAFKRMQSGAAQSARMEMKAAIINAVGQNQPLVPADRLGGIATTPNRILTIRDILPSSTTDSNLIEFTRENAFTNNAGPQVAGSPQAFENVAKPESGITFTLQTASVITLAHFIPASRQVLDDSASLMSHINGRLMYGLKLREETQLLSGTGANHQLNGLITQGTAFVPTSPQQTNELDILRRAIRQAHIAEYRPDFLVLNPADWYDIEIRKVGTGDDRYVVGDPRGGLMPPNLWGLPIVVTNSIAAGTFLMGSSMAAEIKDRQMAAVEMSREDGNNFTRNMVTLLAEERLALVVYRTEAFITGGL